MLIPFISLLFIQVQPTPQNTAPLKAAIVQGLVTRIGTSEPLAQAKVTFIRNGSSSSSRAGLSFSTVTAADGTFTVKDIEPGRYRVFAARNDFSTQELGERSPGGPGITVNLNAGQVLKDVHFQLAQAGIVTGRVLTPSGEPLPRVVVDLLRATYDRSGRRRMVRVATAGSDDRGEYRLFWIQAGRYILRANSSASLSDFDFLESLNSRDISIPDPARKQAEMPSYYPSTFYPSETDESRAAVVEVRPGAELSGFDIRMDSQPRFRVRGRVVDALGRPTRANIFISSSNPESETSSLSRDAAAPGRFEFQNVAAGSYSIGAWSGNPFSRADVPQTFETARSLINVSNDVEDIVLRLTPGVTISGHLTLDGTAPSIPGADLLRIRLEATDDQGLSNLNPPPASVIKGSFTIVGIAPGVYRVSVMNSLPGTYVKSVSLGLTEILSGTLSVSDSNSDPLQIEMSTKVGQIVGSITDNEGRPLESVHSVLIPDSRYRRDLYRDAVSNPEGGFRFKDVAPGNYKIFAWDAVEPNGWFDPEFLKESDAFGKSLTVFESGNITIKLNPIKRP